MKSIGSNFFIEDFILFKKIDSENLPGTCEIDYCKVKEQLVLEET